MRSADPDRDADRCAAIYAPSVTGGHSSFEEAPPGPEEMAVRIASSHAWLVCERDGVVAGYAYAGPHNLREGYRWSVNVAVYVDAAFQGRGVGRELYGALLPALREAGLRWAVALIALPNPASVALHDAFGFRPAGVLREIGWKAGAWRDVGHYQCELSPLEGSPPPEPRVVRAR